MGLRLEHYEAEPWQFKHFPDENAARLSSPAVSAARLAGSGGAESDDHSNWVAAGQEKEVL